LQSQEETFVSEKLYRKLCHLTHNFSSKDKKRKNIEAGPQSARIADKIKKRGLTKAKTHLAGEEAKQRGERTSKEDTKTRKGRNTLAKGV